MKKILPLLCLALLLPSAAWPFVTGDRVRVTDPIWVHPNCPGFAPACATSPGSASEPIYPAGTLGTVTGAETTTEGWTWVKVKFDSPLIEGYVTVPYLTLASSPPPSLPLKVTGVTVALISNPVLAWTANSESDLASYRVYVREAGQSYPISGNDVGNVTSYTVPGLTQGKTYFFAITAVDTAGNESGKSNEVSYSIP